jgi:hypothetical protein
MNVNHVIAVRSDQLFGNNLHTPSEHYEFDISLEIRMVAYYHCDLGVPESGNTVHKQLVEMRHLPGHEDSYADRMLFEPHIPIHLMR